MSKLINPQFEKVMESNQILFIDKVKTNFCHIDVNRGRIVTVTEGTFKNIDSGVIEFRGMLFKYSNISRKQAQQLVRKAFGDWEKENLFQSMNEIWSGVHVALEVLRTLGKRNQVSKDAGRIEQLFLSCSSMLLKILQFGEGHISIYMILDSCLELYRIFCVSGSEVSAWSKESNVVLLSAIASTVLPKSLFDVFRRISMLTSEKVLDSPGGLLSLYSLVCEYLTKFFELVPFKIPDELLSYVKPLITVGFFDKVLAMQNLVQQWRKVPRVMSEDGFQSDVKVLKEYMASHPSMLDWIKRSASLQAKYKDFQSLCKAMDSYHESSRIEPVCIILEGQPGSGKSVFVNQLIEVLEMAAYSHSVKPTMEGKDYHDTYNNEDIYYMDDVGQMGVSQWRTIINIVSPVKLPLECAAVELKDTKYFSSKLLLLTTNRFMTLGGLSKADCIDDVKALWRRGFVFKAKRGALPSEIKLSFHYYDVFSDRWIEGFPKDFQSHLLLKGLKIPSNSDQLNHLETLSWARLITLELLSLKESQFVGNKLTKMDIASVKNISKFLFSEESFEGAFSYVKEKQHQANELGNIIKEYIVDTKDFIVNYLSSCMSTLFDKVGGFDKIRDYIIIPLAVSFIVSIVNLAVSKIGNWYLGRRSDRLGFAMETEETQQILERFNAINDKGRHPLIDAISKQILEVDIVARDGKTRSTSVGLFSGNKFLTVNHSSDTDEACAIVYKDRARNHRIVDNLPVKKIFKDLATDSCVWELPKYYPSRFKNLSHCFKVSEKNYKSYLLMPGAVVDIDKIRAEPVDIPSPYMVRSSKDVYVNSVGPDDYFYTLRSKGMCGSAVVSDSGLYQGMHVAGSSTLGKGCALKYPSSIIQEIHKCFAEEDYFKVDAEESDKVIENFSGSKLNIKGDAFGATNTNFVPSPLYGVFQVGRQPANLTVNGPHTVKDVAKKSFVPVQSVDLAEVDFAEKVLDLLIPEFSPLPMVEVIKGNDKLAKLNPDSSNGYGFEKGKEVYVDYERGVLTERGEKEYQEFLDKILSYNLKVPDIVSVESLKDELRNVDKILPRSFRVCGLYLQILTKTVFGQLVEKTIEQRDFSGITIGINPHKEWPKIFEDINTAYKWAGDIKSWDGAMLPQVQHMLYKIYRRKFKGNSVYLDFIFLNLIFNTVMVNDDVYVTTHSMPSGIFLTMLMNCHVNRAYTAMWYHRYAPSNMRNNPVNCIRDVRDYVHGDDKLNVLKNKSLKNVLNAVTMKEFFQSIGMDFTDSSKNPITKPFQGMEEITFLKRSFVWHTKLRRIVAPLDLNSMYSTISWIDKTKEGDVLGDKLHNFQRELFLHEHRYLVDMHVLEKTCRERGVKLDVLPQGYLMELYTNPELLSGEEQYGVKTV